MMARDNKNNDIIYVSSLRTRRVLCYQHIIYQLIACYLVAPALNRNETVRVYNIQNSIKLTIIK